MESILLKSEETENVLLVEKKENKYLKQRNGELEGQNKTLQNKLLSTSSADTQLQMQIEENNKLKVRRFELCLKRGLRKVGQNGVKGV